MTNLSSSKIYHLHEDRFTGVKLQLARERLNISRAELARRIQISPSFITACEKDRKRPSRELETLLASQLRLTRHYFYGTISGRWDLNDCHFRHRQRVTKTEKSLVRGQLYFYSRVISALRHFVRLPQVNLPRVTVYDLRSTEQIAGEVRRLWGIGASSPIHQLCRLIENAGVLIAFHTADVANIDAASHPGEAIILVRRRSCGATRINSDVGHELAELIFQDSSNGTVEHEKKMNRFVGALLMPECGFAPHFAAGRLTISHLWELKKTWGASLSAIVQRALELALLSEANFVTWKRCFAARGWSRLEPNEPKLPGPELLHRSLDVMMRQNVSLQRFATDVGLSELGFAELLRDNGLGNLMTGVAKPFERQNRPQASSTRQAITLTVMK